MDAIGGDERLASHGLAAGAKRRVDEMRGDAAFVLKKAGQARSRAYRVRAKLGENGVVDDFLQPPAMD
jgi:hypothetical protein